MSVEELFEKIKKLGNKRKWWVKLPHRNLGYFNGEKLKYIRFYKTDFNEKLAKDVDDLLDYDLLYYFREIVYEYIPESKGSNIILYYTSNSSICLNKDLQKTTPHIVL